MSDNASSILKKLNTKIDSLTIDKTSAKEIKAELKELASFVASDILIDQLEQLNTRLDTLESNNTSLKDSVYDFVTSTTKTLETIAKTNDSDNANELNVFLKELENKIDTYISHSEEATTAPISKLNDEEHFRKLKEELTYFQNELETRINENFSGIGDTVNTIISEIRDKMTDLQEDVERNSETLITNIISDIKQLKADSLEIVESVKNIDNKALKNTEKKIEQVIDVTQKANDTLINEVQELKTITAKASVLDAKNKETVETFKTELTALKTNIHTQIREVLSKIVIQDEIKFLCEEAITGIKNNGTETGVVRKYLKELKIGDDKQIQLFSEIKTILTELSDYELNENSDKVDVIYENLGMLNTWASSSDKLTENFDILREDFDLNNDKIDIIYENLTFINEWVRTLDKFSKDIETLRNRCENDVKLPQRIDEIYDNIVAVKEWSKKADALALQVRALSVQIGETESTINSKNLSDMKSMFAQLTDDMSNLSSRTNRMILESDKTNDIMRSQLVEFKSLINTLEQKSTNLGIEKLTNKIEEIKKISAKNSGFEKVVTESFSYLAEWIDGAGSAINEIKTNLSQVQNQQQQQIANIQSLQETQAPVVPDASNQEIIEHLRELADLIEQNENNNQIRMSQIANNKTSENTSQNDCSDLKPMLDFIASQVVNANENAMKTDLLSKKIETLELKMSSFERYMSKLIDYLDED